jgi:hypothetical protein
LLHMSQMISAQWHYLVFENELCERSAIIRRERLHFVFLAVAPQTDAVAAFFNYKFQYQIFQNRSRISVCDLRALSSSLIKRRHVRAMEQRRD